MSTNRNCSQLSTNGKVKSILRVLRELRVRFILRVLRVGVFRGGAPRGGGCGRRECRRGDFAQPGGDVVGPVAGNGGPQGRSVGGPDFEQIVARRNLLPEKPPRPRGHFPAAARKRPAEDPGDPAGIVEDESQQFQLLRAKRLKGDRENGEREQRKDKNDVGRNAPRRKHGAGEE